MLCWGMGLLGSKPISVSALVRVQVTLVLPMGKNHDL